MKTTYNGYTNTPRQEKLKWEFDWFDYNASTERVRNINPFMRRKIIPTGCCCIREELAYSVKCRYYNDISTIIRCELLGVDSLESPCLKKAIKICNEPERNIIKHEMEKFE